MNAIAGGGDAPRERGDDSQSEDGEVAREYRDVAHRLVRAERTALGELRARHEVTGETLRAIERDLDLEEATAALMATSRPGSEEQAPDG